MSNQSNSPESRFSLTHIPLREKLIVVLGTAAAGISGVVWGIHIGGDQNTASSDTIPVATEVPKTTETTETSITFPEPEGSIDCYGEPVRIVVHSEADIPVLAILSHSPDLHDESQAMEVFNNSLFQDLNKHNFDETNLHIGDIYFTPSICVDAADGP